MVLHRRFQRRKAGQLWRIGALGLMEVLSDRNAALLAASYEQRDDACQKRQHEE